MHGHLNVKLGVLLNIILKFSSYLMENTYITSTLASLSTLLGKIIAVSASNPKRYPNAQCEKNCSD